MKVKFTIPYAEDLMDILAKGGSGSVNKLPAGCRLLSVRWKDKEVEVAIETDLAKFDAPTIDCEEA